MNWAKWLAIFSTTALVGLTFTTQDLYRNQSDVQHTLAEQSNVRAQQQRAAQVENCEKVGEPLRHAVVRKSRIDSERLRDDNRESKANEKAGLFADLLPRLSPAQVKQLVEKERQKNTRQAHDLEKIADKLARAKPCEQRYPQPLLLDPNAPVPKTP